MNKASTICDKCQTSFIIEQKERYLDKDVRQKYIKCPKCGKEYTVLIIDQYVQERINQVQKIVINAGDHKQAIRALEKKKLLVEEARKRDKELREKYNR
jgi:PHP family Zn ribbon phosphoesterase